MSIETSERRLRLVVLGGLAFACIGLLVYATIRVPFAALGLLGVVAVVVFAVVDRLDPDEQNRRFVVRRRR